MNKKALISVLVLVFIGVVFVFTFNSSTQEPENDSDSQVGLIDCLAANSFVIYGSSTCPACAQLVNSLGGYEAVTPIYVECNEEQDRCAENMQTNYVPEIQINGEVYTGSRDPQALAEQVGCKI